MTNTTKPAVYREQWDCSPTLATNYAAHLILDAASKSTPVTAEQAKRGMADVIGYALSHPDRYVQDNAMKHFVIPTVQSNSSLFVFGARVNDAWRNYTDVRNAMTNPAFIALAAAQGTGQEAMLAGARQIFDTAVAGLVDEYVGHLAAMPPRDPRIDAYCAALGERAVASAVEWRAADARRVLGIKE